MADNDTSPDFVVETGVKPIVIEVGTKKESSRQTIKYKEQKRYGVIINASASTFEVRNNTLIIPLSWFLLL